MAKAGPDKELCGAWISKREKHCEMRAGAGTPHSGVGRCSRHGGNSPTHVANGQLALAKLAATQLAIPVITDEFTALRDGLAEANGYVEYYRRKVQELDPDMVWVRPTSILRRPLDEGKEGENPSIEVEEVTEAPLEVNIAIKAHRQAMLDRHMIAKTIAALNIEARHLKLQEALGQEVAGIMRGFAEDLGVEVDTRVLGFMLKRLAAIDSTAVEES